MIEVMKDHSAIFAVIFNLLSMIVLVALTWQKMRDQIGALKERAGENKTAIQKSYLDLKEMFIKDIQTFRTDHDRTRDILSAHVMDDTIHQSEAEKTFRAEWREAVMARLARIEDMIAEIHEGVGKIRQENKAR